MRALDENARLVFVAPRQITRSLREMLRENLALSRARAENVSRVTPTSEYRVSRRATYNGRDETSMLITAG